MKKAVQDRDMLSFSMSSPELQQHEPLQVSDVRKSDRLPRYNQIRDGNRRLCRWLNGCNTLNEQMTLFFNKSEKNGSWITSDRTTEANFNRR